MTSVDFTPSPQLAAGLARPASEGTPLWEIVVPRRPLVDDLRAVPDDAEFVATRGTAAGLARIARLPRLTALWANPASPELFRACGEAPRLRALYVAHFKQMADVPLAGAPALEHLLLDWAPRLVDLGFLRGLPTLRTLSLASMKRVDLDTLPELPNLTGLYLDGGMWSTLQVRSLEPLTRLPGLRHLHLDNVRPQDGSLHPLTRLSGLRELDLPNFFELEEVARLSAALPGVTSNTLSPFYGRRENGPSRGTPFDCPRCGEARRMMTGRPRVFLCPSCDAVKMRRRVARWETARLSSWPARALGTD